MAGQKRLVEAITPMEEDFTRWCTDIMKKTELMDCPNVRDCMVIEPYGWAIWENIRGLLDKHFKELGHQDVAVPLFIPENLLQKKKDHVEGFVSEVAWVTHGGNEEPPERLCVRSISETLFCDYYAYEIQSWHNLPKLYSQWYSMIRWEKTTRPSLRSVEFH